MPFLRSSPAARSTSKAPKRTNFRGGTALVVRHGSRKFSICKCVARAPRSCGSASADAALQYRANASSSRTAGRSRPHRGATMLCASASKPPAKHPHLQAGSWRHPDHRSADSASPSCPLLASHRLGCPLTASPDPLLVVVLGPTGSGKTALSLALAERFGGEIVNCDSVAMYREFEIGTAKPTAAERARAPHHLLDFVDPAGYITAGEYARQAREVLQQIKCAGSFADCGRRNRAVSARAAGGPLRRTRSVRRNCASACASARKRRGTGYLHRILSRLDPPPPRRFTPNDIAQAGAGHRSLPGLADENERNVEAGPRPAAADSASCG